MVAIVHLDILRRAGIAETRRSLHVAQEWNRLVTAAAVLATVPISMAVNAGLHLASVVAVVVAMLPVNRRGHAAETLHEPAT